MLEAQGFYDRPMLSPRRAVLWPLFKGCLVATVALIMVLFFFRLELARAVAVLFGMISFVLISIQGRTGAVWFAQPISRWRSCSGNSSSSARRRKRPHAPGTQGRA